MGSLGNTKRADEAEFIPGGVNIYWINANGTTKWLKRWTPWTDCNANCRPVLVDPPAAPLRAQARFADVVVKNGIGYFASDAGLGVYIVNLRNVTPSNPVTEVLYHVTDKNPVVSGTTPGTNENLQVHDIRVETIGGRVYLFAVGMGITGKAAHFGQIRSASTMSPT